MSTDATPDYCPFRGARLRDETDGYGAHPDRHDDCRKRAEAWAREERDPSSPWTNEEADAAATVRLAVGGVVALLALAYSLLGTGQLLLGVVAATIIVAAFSLGPMLT